MSNVSRASISSGSQLSNNSAASQIRKQENVRNNWENATTVSSELAISSSQPSLYGSSAHQERIIIRIDEYIFMCIQNNYPAL